MGLFLNERYFKTEVFFYGVIQTICITVLATSIVNVIDYYWGSSFDKIAKSYFSVLKDCQTSGLVGIYNEFPLTEESLKKSFMDSKNVFIIMNDAKSFISGNELLKVRIEKPNCRTVFILQDYEQLDTIAALTRKNGHDQTPGYYVDKIKNVIDYHINSLYKVKNPTHELNIFLNNNYNTLAIVLLDDFAMYSIYRVSSEKGVVPHFIFKKGCTEYNFIKKDVDNLICRCKMCDINTSSDCADENILESKNHI